MFDTSESFFWQDWCDSRLLTHLCETLLTQVAQVSFGKGGTNENLSLVFLTDLYSEQWEVRRVLHAQWVAFVNYASGACG